MIEPKVKYIYSFDIFEGEYILRTDMMYPSGVLHMWSTCEFEVGLSLSSTTVTLIRK